MNEWQHLNKQYGQAVINYAAVMEQIHNLELCYTEVA
jgi:hypothetical protein